MPKYIMSDSRTFTNYQSSCIMEEFLQKKYNIKNSHDYRSFLQKNAEQIIKDLGDCDINKPDACKSLCPVCKTAVEKK